MTAPNRAERRAAARAAKRPPARTVDVELAGAFEGWRATARADFRASVLSDLQSGRMDRVLEGLEVIVIEHNMPNGAGEVAEHLGDVEPYDGLFALCEKVIDAIAHLPPR